MALSVWRRTFGGRDAGGGNCAEDMSKPCSSCGEGMVLVTERSQAAVPQPMSAMRAPLIGRVRCRSGWMS